MKRFLCGEILAAAVSALPAQAQQLTDRTVKRSRRPTPDDSDAVMAKLKEIEWDDPVFGLSYIRADGRKMHNMYLFEVKSPAESKGPHDYYKLVSTMSGEEAFRPMDQGECPLVKKN